MTITASAHIALGEAFDGVEQLPLDLLDPAVDNPRTDLGELDELVASIHAVGIIEPLVVTANGSGYTIVAGHRRYAAAQQAGLYTVPCIHRAFDSTAERVEVMTIENLQRQDLSPLDEARAFQMLTDLGQSQRQIAERVGCNQSHVSRRLKLLELPPAAQAWVADGRMTVREAEGLNVDELTDEVIEQAAKSAGPVDAWRVGEAARTVRKRELRAEGKSSGLPELKNAWDGVTISDRSRATHWHLNEYQLRIEWRVHDPKPAADRSTSAADQRRADEEKREREREEREARAVERRRLAARHLDELLDVAIIAYLDGSYVEEADPLIALELMGADDGEVDEHDLWRSVCDDSSPKVRKRAFIAASIADIEQQLTRRNHRGYCGSYLDVLKARGWSLDSYEGDVRQEWRRHQDERPDDAAPSEQIQPADLPPAIEADGIEWGDEDPADAAQQIAEGDAAWSADRGFDVAVEGDPNDDLVIALEVHEEERAEQIYNEVVDGRPLIAGRPEIVQRLPWGAYKAAKEHKLVERISRLTDAAKIRQTIAYEWAKGGRRPAVLAAAIQRLDDLAWEAGVEE